MASLKDFFPLPGAQKLPQKNFIKDNIRSVKNCSKVIKNENVSKINNGKPVRLNKTTSTNYRCQKHNLDHLHLKYPDSIRLCTNKPQDVEKNYFINTLQNKGCQTKSDVDLKGARVVCYCSNNISNCSKQDATTQTTEDEHLLQISTRIVNTQTDDTKFAAERSTQTDDKKDSYCELKNLLSSLDRKRKNVDKRNVKENKCNQGDILIKNIPHKLGTVPRYLKERNLLRKQEEAAQQEKSKVEEIQGLKDPDCPPGHMLMPNEERYLQLNILQFEYDKLVTLLNMLPVSNDSYKSKQRKIKIENELSRIEAQMDSLKKSKIFVKIRIPTSEIGT